MLSGAAALAAVHQTDGGEGGDSTRAATNPASLSKRVVACLDVRSNDNGDLVVTKGESYDVREASEDGSGAKGKVRNLGKPVELAARYYQEGADEASNLSPL